MAGASAESIWPSAILSASIQAPAPSAPAVALSARFAAPALANAARTFASAALNIGARLRISAEESTFPSSMKGCRSGFSSTSRAPAVEE